MRKCFLAILLCLLLVAGSFSAYKSGRKLPIIIEAKKLIADNRAGVVDFIGDVTATKGDMKLVCDRMKVYLKKGKVFKIVAVGHVEVLLKDKVVKSGNATYYAQDERIVFEGNPEIWKGENVVRGGRIIYFIKDDRSIVETDNAVSTVKAIISPSEAKGESKGSGTR